MARSQEPVPVREFPNEGRCPVTNRQVFVVVNPVSGQAKAADVSQVLKDTFESVGWTYQIYETTGNDDLAAVIDEARQAGANLIVAAGGDGTIADVASALVGKDLLLGIIPLGTGNVLSLELGIPQTVDAAAELLVVGTQICCLDAMKVGDHYYFLQIGIGLDSLMIRDTSRAAKRRFGRLAYMVTLARALIGYRTRRLSIDIDGTEHRLHGWDVLIANAGILGTPLLHWSPEICPTDGHLNLIVVEIQNPVDILRAGCQLLFELPRSGPPLVLYQVHRYCRVATARPAPIQADGEIIGNTPVRVDVVPRALSVLVPEECPALPCSVEARAEEGRKRARRLEKLLRPWLGPLGVLDVNVALLSNELPRPPILNLFMHTLARVMTRGDGWLFGLLVSILQRKAQPITFPRVAIPLYLTNAVVELILKRVVRRDRPFQSRVLAPVIGKKPSGHSFPSGHAAAAFAAAWLLGRYFPGSRPALYGFAGLVAFSRVYLGVHFFTDVIAGAVSGTILAAAFSKAVNALLDRF